MDRIYWTKNRKVLLLRIGLYEKECKINLT